MNKYNEFYITDYGALADGKTDCTKFIQQAIDDASECQGVVKIPAGNFLTGYLKLKAHTTISGVKGWSYRANGGSILTLNDKNAPCLLDITNAYGCSIENLCLSGNNKLGDNIHGIATIREDEEELFEEDTPRIEGVRVSDFSGDGVHLQRIWCFSVRHNMLGFNKGNGLYIKGWDGFIMDNWFSYNDGAGILSDKEVSALVLNANRVEWNKVAGFKFINPISINIVGNAFDASGGPAIDLNNEKGQRSINMTIMGNTFQRNGMPLRRDESVGESCHIHLTRAMNVVIQGNTLYEAIDDCGNRDMVCPKTGLIIEKLKDCVIKDNVMMNCATENVVIDRGNHEDGNVIEIKGSTKAKAGVWIYPFFEE